MSSPYPVLGTKPIDQWKVTELKEELKRRRLKTNGLKDDLIRRLDDALRVEMENDEALRTERESVKALRSEQKNAAKAVVDVDNGVHLENPPIVGVKMEEAVPVVAEMVKDVVDDAANRDEKVDNVMIQVGTTEIVTAMGTGELQEEVQMGGIDSSSTDEDLNVHASTVETSITVTESVVSEVALSVKATGTGELQEEVQMGGIDSSRKEEDLNVHATTVETSITVAKSVVPEVALSGQDVQNSGTQEANENSNIQLENEGLKPQLENESLKPPDEDATLDSSAPDNQVSEVSPSLGFQVKSDSISTDSVSINEKIELKDNIIADHVKLELDNVKPEMVEPSFSNVVPVGGESHPMDVEEPQEKRESVEEKDDSSGTNAYMSKNNDSVDVGYSEKLNLDRSSGDDSMEEDVLESKQIDSKYNSDEVGDGSEKKNEGPVVKEENLVGVAGKDLSTDQKEVHVENKIHPVVPVEKRKFNDQEIVGNSEPLKRQRRWNSENIKVPEQQSSNLTPTTTPKDGFQPAPLRRNFSRSDWLAFFFQIFLQILRAVGPQSLSSPSHTFKPLPLVELPETTDPPPATVEIPAGTEAISANEPIQKLTVVLDLDETLVCAYETSSLPALLCNQAIEAGLKWFELECASSDKECEGKLKINYVTVFERPGLDEFLKQLSEFADLVLFTAGLEGYARPLVDRIDTENRFSLRLYRPSTTSTEYQEHVKDLSCISNDPCRIVIVDNNPFSFLLQPLNGIPCVPFSAGQPHDTQLLDVLLPLLKHLSQQNDVRPVLSERFRMLEWFQKQGIPASGWT